MLCVGLLVTLFQPTQINTRGKDGAIVSGEDAQTQYDFLERLSFGSANVTETEMKSERASEQDDGDLMRMLAGGECSLDRSFGTIW